MIKSTKTTLKFSNKTKLTYLHLFIDEYKIVVSKFIDIFWELNNVPKLVSKEFTSQIDSWLSARAINSAGKQASGIIRGTRRKQNKRLYIINKLLKENKPRKAKKLQRIYDTTKVSKPTIDQINPELDAKFIKLDLDNPTSFDGWITLTSLGNKLKLVIPFKKSKHFNKMLLKGNLKSGVRLSKKNITFNFELPKKEKKETGSTLGIDIGQTTLISCSNDYVSKKNTHNHDLSTITSILSRKTKGSKGFQRTTQHRKNYINWSINQLNLNDIKQVNIENIKNLRLGKKRSRSLSHWTYTDIFDKLESYCEEQGVLVQSVNPTYTSQRCSVCGWTRKSNRKGKLFKCGKCNFTLDSDLNASKNIALMLPTISWEQRLKQINRTGFYWNVLGQESGVPVVQRTIMDKIP